MMKSVKNYLATQYHSYKKEKNFKAQLRLFVEKDKNTRLSVRENDLLRCLNDNTGVTHFDAHYVYHPAWAARFIKKNNPSKHIDISSTLHFCTMLSAFIPTEFYDYRPAELNLDNLSSASADLTNLFFADNSVNSISCMHTIEHIGLGRYGDPIDPEGDIKAINELQRVTAKDGHLFLVTPVGKPRIQFNAHRIYSFDMIKDLFAGFELKDFSLVTDNAKFVHSANPKLVQEQSYGCGCFYFKKNNS